MLERFAAGYALVDRHGWLLLFMAGLFEILWIFCLKTSNGYTKLLPTLATIPLALLSTGLLAMAMRSIPLGTAYAIWVGIGAMGAIIMGVLIFKEDLNLPRLLCIALIVGGL